jgi:xanthine dehydrogenase accessory factor
MLSALPSWPVFGYADDIRPALKAAMAAGEPAALATIVGLDGGGPRPVGSQMLITSNAISGFLSGGCLEGDVAAHSHAVLADGAPKTLVYGEGSPWPDIRLLCGARIVIQLERILPDDEAANTLLQFTHSRRRACWISDGVNRLCLPRGITIPPPGVFLKDFDPIPRLVVLGSDPTALAIATLGMQSGFETTLVRPKGPPEPPPIPGIGYRRDDDPAAALEALGLDPWTAVAVATHDAELDHAALVAALPSAAFYVGALGARRRLADRQIWLRQSGLAEADIARLHAPIGLDIGGKAPWEVAVAVLGEITAERQKRAGALTE